MSERTKKFIRDLRGLLIIPATFLLTLLAGANPAVVETVYSGALFRLIAALIPCQYIPFVSFFELFLLLVPLILLAGLVFFVRALVRNKENRRWRVLELLRRVLLVGGATYFLFYVCWGFNYYRQPYSVIANLPLQPSSREELRELCEGLIDKTNEARAKLPSAEDNTLAISFSAAEWQDITRQAFAKAQAEGIPGITAARVSAKPLFFSRAISYLGITGFYISLTAEAHYNDDAPVPFKGSTICHEMAHRQGFAREDEANFLAYYVCAGAQDDYLNYSGHLLAVVYSMNQLYENDREAYGELYGRYSDEVLADLQANNSYWRAFEGKAEETFTQMNDAYLRGHNLEDGVKSYGRMVDLLLALEREQKNAAA